jgi:hypothetical protein
LPSTRESATGLRHPPLYTDFIKGHVDHPPDGQHSSHQTAATDSNLSAPTRQRDSPTATDALVARSAGSRSRRVSSARRRLDSGSERGESERGEPRSRGGDERRGGPRNRRAAVATGV